MRPILFLLPLTLASAALAQPISETPPTRTIQCIETGGQLIPTTCRVPASRLDKREDICTCPVGGQRVEVAVCGKGEVQPPEGRKLNLARREGLRGDGSLMGDKIDGRAICVAPRGR